MFWCEGCQEVHAFNNTWTFNGDQLNPTVSPSLLVTAGKSRPEYRCHSFIRDGKIEYLSDCSHNLAGKTIDLKPFLND